MATASAARLLRLHREDTWIVRAASILTQAADSNLTWDRLLHFESESVDKSIKSLLLDDWFVERHLFAFLVLFTLLLAGLDA